MLRRLARALPVAIVGVVLVGVVVLIVVEVAGYDGRTPAEVTRDRRSEHLASLTRCPKRGPPSFEGETDPGTKGEAVPPDPESALICSWAEKYVPGNGFRPVTTERILHRRGDLDELTDALNSLPPLMPLPESEYSCPEAEPFDALIGLRYRGSAEAQVEIGPGFCGGYAALSLRYGKQYGVPSGLLRLLDRLSHPDRIPE